MARVSRWRRRSDHDDHSVEYVVEEMVNCICAEEERTYSELLQITILTNATHFTALKSCD